MVIIEGWNILPSPAIEKYENKIKWLLEEKIKKEWLTKDIITAFNCHFYILIQSGVAAHQEFIL